MTLQFPQMSAPGSHNPYQSPREAEPKQPDFSDRQAELAELRQRVLELERQVERSWFVRRNFLLRIFAVWGYFLLGYGMMAVMVFAVMALIRLLTGQWPS